MKTLFDRKNVIYKGICCECFTTVEANGEEVIPNTFWDQLLRWSVWPKIRCPHDCDWIEMKFERNEHGT